MERVERIKHLNVRGFWAQGIVSADATIRMPTASYPPGDYHLTGSAGLLSGRKTSFCR
jgi:hypothetical protein